METGSAPLTRLGRYARLAALAGGHGNAVRVRLQLLAARATKKLLGRANPSEVRIPVRGVASGLLVRTGSSDLPLFNEIFITGEFAWAGELTGVKTIIDCGANVGYVSALLLAQFPDARAVAVEPDPSNLAQCRRNLAPFADRVTLLQAGVWHRPAGLKIKRFDAESMWGLQVLEAGPGETPDVHATTLPAIMADAGFDRVNLLKLDIEGTERTLFAGDTSWLDRVDNLSIELHGDACRDAFLAAMANYDYAMREAHGICVCLGIRRKTPATVSPQ